MDKYCVIRFKGKDDYYGGEVIFSGAGLDEAKRFADEEYMTSQEDAFDVCPENCDGTPDYGNTVISFGWEN